MSRHQVPARPGGLALVLAGLLAAGTVGAAGPASAHGSPGPAASPWVRDSIGVLDVFLPDADSDYYINGFGTEKARTVITGRVPNARYWSFTAYPLAPGGKTAHVHDRDIARAHGRYTVTVSASCAHVAGTCISTGSGGGAGILVMRLYVPVDVHGAGTGGVPLPTISYVNGAGAPISLTAAAGTSTVTNGLQALRLRRGARPAALTRSYPPAAPVPTPVRLPTPVGVVTGPRGPYANPDNVYDHVSYSTTRGDLVVTAQAPTYRSDTFSPVNALARSGSQPSQVRYWSLCTALKGRHTGACLRDEQVHLIPGSRRFMVVVAPTCPVAGYDNCIPAGPQPLQRSLSYRNLLPSSSFAKDAFRGPYALRATYVARPG
jgi:hypothetical protein